VSLNRGWSGDSDNEKEEKPIEVINEVEKKRANSADHLDNLEESELENNNLPQDQKKKMVTSAVQMKAMRSSKLTKSKF
jgi:hypothetical protein